MCDECQDNPRMNLHRCVLQHPYVNQLMLVRHFDRAFRVIRHRIEGIRKQQAEEEVAAQLVVSGVQVADAVQLAIATKIQRQLQSSAFQVEVFEKLWARLREEGGQDPPEYEDPPAYTEN